MWTIEQFRTAVIIGSIIFISLLAVACIIGQAIQFKKCQALLQQAEELERARK